MTKYNPSVWKIENFNPTTGDAPYWKDIGNERALFRTTYNIKLPMVFTGPTGTGKSTLARRMQWEIGQDLAKEKFTPQFTFNEETGLYEPADKQEQKAPLFPLYIVEGNEDTEVIHLVGGYNAAGKFIGGPMYHWAHTGGILLVEEIAEMRGDVQTVFHGALSEKRFITFPDLAKIVELPDHAMFVAAYNPMYQTKKVSLKTSTRQRLPVIDFAYPDVDTEAEIVHNAAVYQGRKLDEETAHKLAQIASDIRNDDEDTGSFLSTREGASTRLLVMAGKYILAGATPYDACITAIVGPISNTRQEREALEVILESNGISQ